MEEQRNDNNNNNSGRRIRINVSQSVRRQRYARNTMSSNLIQRSKPILSDHNCLSSTPYHTVFVFLNDLLVGVLQVNGQGTNSTKALIEAHTANVCTFLSALLIYCFAYFAEVKYSQRRQILSCIAVISGTLSSVSLVSMILPRPFGYFSFILWAFILLLVAGLHVRNRFRGIKQQQLLPL